MSAIDNKHLIDIVGVSYSSGTSKASGKPWEMYRAQCVVSGPDNAVKVGELLLPKDLKDTPPGRYLAEFELDVSFDRLVVPRIIALHPHGSQKPSAKAPVNEPAKAAA